MSCIFCKIINKELPAHIIYEDEYTLAFLDIANDVNGHMLIVPKKHVNNIFDCNTETLHHVMNTVQIVSKHCIQKGYDGVNLLHASDESAGQSVMHFHIHLIPRRKNDQVDAWPHFSGSTMNLKEIHSLLKMEDLQ